METDSALCTADPAVYDQQLARADATKTIKRSMSSSVAKLYRGAMARLKFGSSKDLKEQDDDGIDDSLFECAFIDNAMRSTAPTGN